MRPYLLAIVGLSITGIVAYSDLNHPTPLLAQDGSSPQLFPSSPHLPPSGPQLSACVDATIKIQLTATPTSPFSVELTWSGPPGDYEISGPVSAKVIVNPVLPQSAHPSPHSNIAGDSIFSLSQAQHEQTAQGRYEHKSRPLSSPVLPDSDYYYTVHTKLPDGTKACGTAKAKTLSAPAIANLGGWYVNPNDIRLEFVLPPYVNAVNVYRDNLTIGWKPAARKLVYQRIRKSAFDAEWTFRHPDELQIIHPGLPSLPNDYTTSTPYNLTVEAVWFDSSGNPARAVSAPIRIAGPRPIRGFADTHAHQFANLAFGGLFVWGKVWGENGGGISEALPWCDYWPGDWYPIPYGGSIPTLMTIKPFTLAPPFNPKPQFTVHGPNGMNDIIGTFVAKGAPGWPAHPVGGSDAFDGWPRWNSVSHQMMYYEWLKRAYDGGMRLMVMHAVNSKFLCEKLTRIYNCDDMEAVDRQLRAAHDLEDYIDKRSGGKGKGWYHIVRSPEEARKAIANDQMAIVMGIEVPDLFGCASNPSQCADTTGRLRPHVITELMKYTGPGYDVRHFFPIHSFDNAFGGTAYFQDMYRVAQRLITNQELNPRPCSEEGIDFVFETNDWASSFVNTISGGDILKPFDNFPFAVCNAIGLKEAGKNFIRELMDQHLIIDIDHMSHLAIDSVLQIAATKNYPIVSGHAGFLETSIGQSKRHEAQQKGDHLQSIAKLGGMGGVITAQGKVARLTFGVVPNVDWFDHKNDHVENDGLPILPQGDGIAQYSTTIKNDCSNSSKTFAQAYLFAIDQYGLIGEYGTEGARKRTAVAFGTDMQGAWIQPGPRFGEDGCSGATEGLLGHHRDQEKTAQTNQVKYPFRYPWSRFWQMPKAKVGNKEFDINTDGLANVGMLPDFIADLFAIGLTEADLQPLFQSAEGYIRMWERASYRATSEGQN